jgi:hypothetical protein
MRRIYPISFSLFLIFLLSACDKDESNESVENPEIKATLTLRNLNGSTDSNPWTLPDVSATRRNENLIITAYNSTSGEVFTMRVPDDGPQYYSNTSGSTDQGYASWRRDANSIAWYSTLFSEGTLGDYVVDLQSIDTESNTVSGTFFMSVYNPASSENAFFGNGSFSNVPIVLSESDDEITENKVSLKANGLNFNPTSIDILTDSTGTQLNIRAVNSTEAVITLSIPRNAVSLGEYSIGQDVNDLQVSYQAPGFNPHPGLNGYLLVETHDELSKTMSGNFEFEAGEFNTPNHTITEGRFEILY